MNLSFVHAGGAATSLNDVVAGRIPISFEGIAGQRAATESGAIRLLATAAPKRLPNLPDVPVVAETVPGMVSVGWLALMGPAGMPDSIVRKIAADMKTVLANPEVVERFHVLGTYPVDLTPEQLFAYMRAEEQRWWPLVRQVEADSRKRPARPIRHRPPRRPAQCRMSAFARRAIAKLRNQKPETENWMRSWSKLWCVTALVVAATAPAQAQDYPNKPVTFITPAAAGNSPDVVTRIVADKLTANLEAADRGAQPPRRRRADRRPGRGRRNIEKDGYTLYMTQASTWTVLPITQEARCRSTCTRRSCRSAWSASSRSRLAVNKDVPAKTVAELIALINKTPDGMLFAATNRGGQSHLTGELFRDRSKANMSFVHAAGAAVSLNDVIAGRIPIMFEGLAALAPGLQGGGIRLLGVAAQKRLPNLPDLPAINETVPGVVSSGWIVLMAPAGVPDSDHPEAQRRPAQGRGPARRDRAVPDARHLFARPDPAQTDEFMRNEEKLWWPIVRQVEADDNKAK